MRRAATPEPTDPDAQTRRPRPDIAPADALTAAYLTEADALRAFVFRRTGDRQAAEDIVQEVYVRIARQSEEGGMPVNPAAFLRTVTANLALDWLRRRSFRGRFAADAGAEIAPDVAPGAERSLHARRAVAYLQTLIADLPEKQRKAFLLYRGEGLTLSDAARALGLPLKTVHSQAATALETLRARMEQAGFWP